MTVNYEQYVQRLVNLGGHIGVSASALVKYSDDEARDNHGRWVSSLIDDVQREGGASMHVPEMTKPETGFMVSYKEHSAIISAPDFFNADRGRDLLDDYVSKHASVLSDPDCYLGIWHDKDSGKIFLDVSRNLQNRDEAIKLGQQHDQIAIWDVKGAAEIPTGGTGGLGKGARMSADRTFVQPTKRLDEMTRDEIRAWTTGVWENLTGKEAKDGGDEAS